MSEEIDYSKVQRYDMITHHGYDDDSWEAMGKCNYGNYILYSDYVKLLKEQILPRLPASFYDVVQLLENEIAVFKNRCFDVFERKNTINYSYAICQYKHAEQLQKIVTLIKERVEYKDHEVSSNITK